MLEEYQSIALSFLQTTSREFNKLGLELIISVDMEEFVHEARIARPEHVSPTHNPEESVLNANNSYWIKVTFRDQVIGFIATRIFQTNSLAMLVKSNEVWWDKHPIEVSPVDILDWDGVNSICGCVAFSAGLYVSKEFRNKGIGKAISRVTRAHAFLNFSPDYHISFIHSENFKKNSPGNNYMNGNKFFLLLHGNYPPLRKILHVRIAYMTPELVIEALRDTEIPTMLGSNGGD